MKTYILGKLSVLYMASFDQIFNYLVTLK